ncbi:cobalt-precorrin-5B (C(1))-methyltransferase CbiD [Zongyangia hominis]|uniref:Cobalt-precorrin-5B C(1)-methyltransferase n=1 Tax=Zongyangia hominis TaxID=2763677 RepID=A0A926EBP7_9FIRM|nr:cobalt-precorrin-5B (C(1))-methyltransferase CbiD [Zongyangia hominis]MBC8569289.1 cobalamin biosynthesis protein CbiD [Zongyangia hominis]
MGKLDYYIYQNGERLRCGYTTGSCAAGAAAAAVQMLLGLGRPAQVGIKTPKGIPLTLDIEDIHLAEGAASCAVRKDGGDDIDATDGLCIYATARKRETGFLLTGGAGIGTVTRPGLECAVGEAAINRVPRRMIREAVERVCVEAGYEGGIWVEISVPGGEEIARRTFNPRLGIEGGISILGTSGIVEPMSEKALIATIEAEMDVIRAAGRREIVLTPGNYGADFIAGHTRIDPGRTVKCSNFLGEALDYAARCGFRQVLLIGHAGKLIKVAAGVMNTHSRTADCRMEVLTAHAALCGAGKETAARLMGCVTVDDAVSVLREEGLLAHVMASVMERVAFYLEARAKGAFETGAILFSNRFGVLGQTENAEKLRKEMEGKAK